jgi:hypothetical protein
MEFQRGHSIDYVHRKINQVRIEMQNFTFA